jgi:AcrR family transcriptional regulator
MPRTGLTAAEIREKAIDATVARMRENGFDRVRLTDIARDLGVSHAALYAHFADKTALLDAVSERWLREIDKNLEAVCRKRREPTDKILSWMLLLHRAKVAKVLHDPELYKAFDLSTAVQKPFAQQHLDTIRGQLVELVREAIAKRRLRDADPEAMAQVISESLMAFHHPKLVAQHIGEKREPLLRRVLEIVLKGLNLTS